MSQNISPKAAFSSSITLICCALIALAIGIFIVARNSGENWLAGLVLIVCGFFVGVNGFGIYRRARKEKEIADEQFALLNRNKEGVKS